MKSYFIPKSDKSRGKPITALPTVINKDLSRIPSGEHQLKTKNYLDHLSSKAEDSTQWRRLSANISEVTNASNLDIYQSNLKNIFKKCSLPHKLKNRSI